MVGFPAETRALHRRPPWLWALGWALAFTSCTGTEPEQAPPWVALGDRDSTVLVVTAEDPLGRAEAVVAWGDRLAVADPYGQNVKVFEWDGSLSQTLGQLGRGPGEFLDPAALAVDARGRLAVLDRQGSRISFFSEDGEYEHGFHAGGGMTTSLDRLDGGESLLLGSWLSDGEGTVTSPSPLHTMNLQGDVTSSFWEIPEASARAETPFVSVYAGVEDDSVVVWGVMGRPFIYATSASGGPVDTIGIAGVSMPDWSEASEDIETLFEWAREFDLLTGVIPAGGGRVIVRFQRGNPRKGTDRYRYAMVSIRSGEILGLTHLTPDRIQVVIRGEAVGIVVRDDGEAVLVRYQLVDP